MSAIHREVILRDKPAAAYLTHRCAEKCLGHVVLLEPFPIVTEGCGIEGRVGDIEAKEPLEKEIVLEAFTELAL